MHEFLIIFLVSFTTYFTLINPLGVMPVFISLTNDINQKERKKTAMKASFLSLFILIGFAITGEFIFEFFNISLNALKIVGGYIFFLMGKDMLQARLQRTKISEKELHSYIKDIAVTPLAIPMIAGPGTITNAIVSMDKASNIIGQLANISALVITIFITYLILVNSSKIIKYIGETGNKVIMRLMGLIVMVIAVEFIIDGIIPIIRSI